MEIPEHGWAAKKTGLCWGANDMEVDVTRLNAIRNMIGAFILYHFLVLLNFKLEALLLLHKITLSSW
jgi:hypothetical protein